uniref:Uncharacterized protein n=1 Tax=Candidatus Kentrum sp. TC TaxID=2126339 RepID=A0A450YXX5_9GAMM|nr:MAG: hypothetical protein BECKTC1821E_GA0114239_10632 [Candidatus Kentron sp. TC]
MGNSPVILVVNLQKRIREFGSIYRGATFFNGPSQSSIAMLTGILHISLSSREIPMNIIQIFNRFPTRKSCINHLESVRWHSGARTSLGESSQTSFIGFQFLVLSDQHREFLIATTGRERFIGLSLSHSRSTAANRTEFSDMLSHALGNPSVPKTTHGFSRIAKKQLCHAFPMNLLYPPFRR